MKKSLATAAGLAVLLAGLCGPAQAQNNVLAEMYGRGVHAYYAGNLTDANQFLSSAIYGGIKDPRAYYFRGIVLQSLGRSYEAESDWSEGARMEAEAGTNMLIGRSLSRFQGSARLKLEQIRQKARLNALAMKKSPSGSPSPAMSGYAAPAATPPATANPVPVVPRSSNPITPPPAAPSADNPFGAGGLAAGDGTVEKDDALEGSMDPFVDDAPDMAVDTTAEPADTDPFGGGGAGSAPDPFGDAGGGGSAPDPFGDAGGSAPDPFGDSDPFN